jgi:hypothetical protein
MPGSFLGRLGGVPDFEWWDSKGVRHETNLVFVADGEFHIVDFNDPENPRELNNPGGGEAFRVAGLGSGVSPDGNTNSDGVIYLSNRSGFAIVQMKRCKKINLKKGCGDDSEGNACTNMTVNPKPFSREACEHCPGLIDIKIDVENDDRTVGVSDPSDESRDSIKFTITFDESFPPTPVTLTQKGIGRVTFRDNPSDEDKESLDLTPSSGSQTIEVFGKSSSKSKGDTMIKVQVGESECEVCQSIVLTVAGIDLDVDSDNNLSIEPEEDEYEEEYPGFIFWVNGDNETDCSPGIDYNDKKINGEKDLEDFATLAIDLSLVPLLLGDGTTSWLPDDYKCFLKMEPIYVSQVQVPNIKIFKKKGYGKKYLSEKDTAEKQLELEEKAFLSIISEEDSGKYQLKKDDLHNKLRGELLFEGVKAGGGYLVLVLEDKDGKIVTKDKVYINIKPLRHLYYMANARACSCPTCESDNPNLVIWPAGTAFSDDNDTGYDCDLTNFNKPNLTVFVHGYNVDECGAFSAWVLRILSWKETKMVIE